MNNLNRLLSDQSLLLSNKHSVQILSWSSASLAGVGFVFLAVMLIFTPVRPNGASASRNISAVSSAAVTLSTSGPSPAAVRVALGSQVVWTNNSNSRITLSSATSGGPSSGDALEPGDSYTFIAATLGTFTYQANGQTGTVVVQ